MRACAADLVCRPLDWFTPFRIPRRRTTHLLPFFSVHTTVADSICASLCQPRAPCVPGAAPRLVYCQVAGSPREAPYRTDRSAQCGTARGCHRHAHFITATQLVVKPLHTRHLVYIRYHPPPPYNQGLRCACRTLPPFSFYGWLALLITPLPLTA